MHFTFFFLLVLFFFSFLFFFFFFFSYFLPLLPPFLEFKITFHLFGRLSLPRSFLLSCLCLFENIFFFPRIFIKSQSHTQFAPPPIFWYDFLEKKILLLLTCFFLVF